MQNINVTCGWNFLEFGTFAFLAKDKYEPNLDEHKQCIELEHIEKETGKLISMSDSSTHTSVKNKFSNNDVLFGKLRPYLKKYYKPDFEGVCSTEIWVLRGKQEILQEYLFLLIQSNKFISACNVSTGSRMPRADWSFVSEIPFLLPPINEQKKIAGILGTWDRAIEELAGLIAEKKELKRGLMQRLLTGTQRLPGFNMAWKEIKCSDVLFERKTYLSKGKELEHVSLTKEGVVPKTARYERDFLVKGEEKEYKITKLNDICYNPANLKFGVICRNTYGDGIFSPIYVTFEVKNMDVVLLGFIVETHMFQGKALRYEQGTVYERMSVGAEDLLRVELTMPSDMAEQKAIADVLSKADAEIDLLNQQLDVLKEQKRGLMQKLLTGEIRVKVDDK